MLNKIFGPYCPQHGQRKQYGNKDVTFISADRINGGYEYGRPEDIYEDTYSDKFLKERANEYQGNDKNEQTQESFPKTDPAEWFDTGVIRARIRG